MKTAFKLTAYTIVLFLAVAMVASSCKKDDTTDDIDTTPKIKTLLRTYSNVTDTTTYAYDSQGRLVKEIINGQASNYSYGSNNIWVVYDSGDTAEEYILNSDGYAASKRYVNMYILNYAYDADGHRISQDGFYTYTWVSGNMTVEAGSSSSAEYTYATDKANTIGNANRGQKYLGTDSKNLANTVKYSGSSTSNTIQYDYDSENRVIRKSYEGFVELYTYY